MDHQAPNEDNYGDFEPMPPIEVENVALSVRNSKEQPSSESFRPIPESWSEGVFHHRVVKRRGRNVLVEKTRPKEKPDWVSYEVAILEVFPAANRFGKDYPERENYPPVSQWGVNAWTYTDRVSAEKRMASLE